jgi:hypothetical protein
MGCSAREDYTVQQLAASILDDAGRQQSEQWARLVVGCGVILFHVLVLILVVRLSPRWSAPEIASTLVLLNLAAAPAAPKLPTRPVTRQRPDSLVSGSSERTSENNPTEGRESGEFDQTLQSASTAPLIDWSGELDSVAKAEAPALLAERLQKCHDAELHGRFLVGCGKVKTPDIWDHHRGLAELLAIGRRQANGHLFDDMNDPDRERSSVPDIVAMQQRPHRPVPLAFDPRRDYFTH